MNMQTDLFNLTIEAMRSLPVTIFEWSLGHLYTSTYINGKLVLYVQRY